VNAVDFSEHAITKGERLHDTGRVTVRGAYEAFVLGDHGVYLVRAFPGGGLTCTCPVVGGRCSHVVAALLAWGDALSEASA
jgi:uncharacterized Zn finger protein